MTLEKKAKEGMFSGMTAKQKGMVGAVVVMFFVVIWQVMGLFGGGEETATPPAATKTASNHAAKTPANTAPSGNQAIQQAELKQIQTTSDTQFLQTQQMAEQKYMDKINSLEDLKIQREIAETNQAIAAAKLATVTAEKSISDLLTKPAPEVSQGAYANKLATPAAQGEGANSQQSTVQADYKVIAVSMQLGKWNAVLGYGGKLYNVGIGDELPVDNSVVTSIEKSGVVLKKDGALRKINIMLAI